MSSTQIEFSTPAMKQLPPELLIPIVEYADEYSTYDNPSEAIHALHATSSVLRALTAPLVPRAPLLRCPLPQCDPCFFQIVNPPPCRNMQYKDSANLDDLFDTIVRLHIDMGMNVNELNPSSQPEYNPCPHCSAVVAHLVRYLDGPSPFPALTCLSVALPSAVMLHDNPGRCQKLLVRLFGLTRLRHVVILDPWPSGPLPLPPIPSNVAVELDLISDINDERLNSYLAILDSVRVLTSPEITHKMLTRWAASLQKLTCAARRMSLEVSNELGPDFPKFSYSHRLLPPLPSSRRTRMVSISRQIISMQ